MAEIKLKVVVTKIVSEVVALEDIEATVALVATVVAMV
jgi:hypothetical protein